MTFDDGTTWNCDQNFAPVALRYQYQYGFNDTWNNPNNVPAYMNTYSVQYKNISYLSRGALWPNARSVYWTNAVTGNGYAVPPNSSTVVLSTYANDWAILSHPAVRTTNDFTIAYQIGYDYSNNYPDASDDISHVECQPYYITWCGDGTVDPAYETCDPAAPGQSSTTCSVTTCTPIAPTPVPGVCSSTINGATYPHTTTAYPSAQCASGTPSVSTFPTPGTTVSWTCSGSAGGAASPTCTATTLPVPVN
jgi:hypothetical protein